MTDQFVLADLVTPALGGIIHALSDRRNQTEAERQAKAEAVTGMILSFQPRDVIEMMLSGQAVLFNELLADGARDTLREEVDTMKPRGRSSVVSMGRLLQGHLDRLERRGNQPYRTEVAAPEVADRAAVAQPVAEVEARMSPLPVEEAAGMGDGMPIGEPVAETSWLDEPYEQWRVETAVELVEKAMMAAKPETRTGAAVETGDFAVWPGMRSDTAHPALPREPAGYPAVRELVEAAAD